MSRSGTAIRFRDPSGAEYNGVVPPTRRPRPSTLEKRTRLLDAVERIMLEDGYAAVTSRRVEAVAGVKVHYHFGTIDELLVAVVRRRGELNLALLADALASDEPLRAWWHLVSEQRGNALLVELSAAANHRPRLRAELAAFAHAVRALQLEALDRLVDSYGLDRTLFPPPLVAAAIQGLGFVAAYDSAAGFETAQDEVAVAMDTLLSHLEARRADRQ